MMSSDRQRRQVYNHASSIKARTPDKDDVLAPLLRQHAAEKAEDGAKRHKATIDLNQQFEEERARDTTHGQVNDPPEMEKRRNELRARLDAATEAMRKRQAAEVKDAEKRNPLP
jgi:hypothetical protein